MTWFGSIETPETRSASKPRMNPMRMRRVRTVVICSAPAIPALACPCWGGDTPAPRLLHIMDAPERLTPQRRALVGLNERLGTLAGGNPRTASRSTPPSLYGYGRLEPCAPSLGSGEPATLGTLAQPSGKINRKRALARIFRPPGRRARPRQAMRDIIVGKTSQAPLRAHPRP